MTQLADPSKQSKAVEAMAEDWALAAALLGGTRAMRAAGEAHLPKWPGEEDEAYRCRLKTATLFPTYLRTVETLSGKPFSKPLTISEDASDTFKAWLENVDLQGRNLHSFAADQMELTMGYGLAGILVDVPRAEGIKTKADEQRAGVRPYMIQIYPSQIRGWRATVKDGQMTFTMLRLMECVTEDYGEFGEKDVDQVRVLEPGKWTTYRQNDKKEWVVHEEGVTTIDFVPFVPTYGDRKGFMTARPPLIEVAYLNVEHWQSASDQQTILHVARVPILAVSGVEDGEWELKVGASVAVKLPMNAKLEFVEHTGAAIEAGRISLEDLEERMRQAGAELLVVKPGKVTATQVASEDATGMCALQRITLDLQDAMNAALDMMAKWMKEAKAPTVKLFNDFGAGTLAEASAELLLKTNQAGKLSDETLLTEYKRRSILSPDVNVGDEKERIAAQGPALASA
jgi:hypothetical protein